MTTSLDDFFKQIITSEEKAQARKSLIHEVRDKGIQLQEDVKEAEHEYKSHQGQLVIKIQQLNETELQKKWLGTKADLLTQQKDALEKENCSLDKNLADVQKNITDCRESFCRDVHSFCQGYDLVSGGEVQRHLLAQTEIEMLQQQQQDLETEVSELRRKMQMVADLSRRKQRLIQQLEVRQQTGKDLDCEVQKQKSKLTKLQKQHQGMLQVPHKDPEFLRLQGELDSCRHQSLEGRCVELQQQLQQLEQQHWQQTLQEKRSRPSGILPGQGHGSTFYGQSQSRPSLPRGPQGLKPRQQGGAMSNAGFLPASQVAGIYPSSASTANLPSGPGSFSVPSDSGNPRANRPNLKRIAQAVKQQSMQKAMK